MAIPATNFLDNDDICRAWISIQNVGAQPSQAVLVFFDAKPDEPTGPLNVECSGLLAPGGHWDLLGPQISHGGNPAMLFSLSARRLSELGVDLEEFARDDLVGTYFCEQLFEKSVGNPQVYAEFRASYGQEMEFLGVPMSKVPGSRLVAQVLRHCPGKQTPGVEVSSTYPGIAVENLDPDALKEPRNYYLAPAGGRDEGAESYVYIQNTSAERTTVTTVFQALDDCDKPVTCGVSTIEPGKSALVAIEACSSGGKTGSLRLETTGTVAAVVDTIMGDSMSSFEAVPLEAVSKHWAGAWLPDSKRGWISQVYVQNPSSIPAQVEVNFLNHRGAALFSQNKTICPGGSTHFDHAFESDLPGMNPGSVRVDSLETQGGQAAEIFAILRVTETDDSDLIEVKSRVEYRLSPIESSNASADSPAASGIEGAGLVLAVPAGLKDLDGTGSTVELALANHTTVPGWTDLAIFEFDQNALLNVRCRRLEAGSSQYFDYQTNRNLDNGFFGSSLVSAVYWSHAEVGSNELHAPSLSATLIMRTGSRREENIPGDELTASEAFALREMPSSIDLWPASICLPKPGLDAPPPPTPSPTPLPGPDPSQAKALGAMAWLPALNYQRRGDTCQSTIEVQNPSDDPAKALLVLWGRAGFCEPHCNGPLQVSCSGLIAPGGSWQFTPDMLPLGTANGLIYSLSAKTLGELGMEGRPELIAADLVCSRTVELMTEDCASEQRFRAAFVRGDLMPGPESPELPLGLVRGPALSVDVNRDCPGNVSPGVIVAARYSALSGADFAPPGTGNANLGFAYTVNPVLAESRDYNTYIYVQNTGLACTQVSFAFQGRGDCLRSRICRVFGLAPGEVFEFDAGNCVGPAWVGEVTIRADQPLAIVSDLVGGDTLLTYPSYPGEHAYDFNKDGEENQADIDLLEAALGAAPGSPNWNPRFDIIKDEIIDESDLDWMRRGMCQWSLPERDARPPQGPPPQRQVHLPSLAWDGGAESGVFGADDCTASVAIQNAGQRASKALLMLWDAESSQTSDSCDGPSKIVCSGLIAPSGSWVFGPEALAGAANGSIYSVDAQVEVELDPGTVTGLADLLCETLHFAATDDCDDYLQFRRAWDDGTDDFAGLPLDEIARGAPLAVRVERDCAHRNARSEVTGARERMAYAGITESRLGAWSDSLSSFGYFAPVLYAKKAGLDSVIIVQNTSLEPAEVEISLSGQNDCGGRSYCDNLLVQPGESVRIQASESCPITPSRPRQDWQGTALVRSNQALAVLAEIAGRSIRIAYPMQPETSSLNRDIDGRPYAAHSSLGKVLFGPIVPDQEAGWDAFVSIQNQSLDKDAWVEVSFLDSEGYTLQTYDERICPGNTEIFFIPVIRVDGAQSIGSVRVVSRPLAGEPWEEAASISGVAGAFLYTDPWRSETLEGRAYPLLPESHVGPWPFGADLAGHDPSDPNQAAAAEEAARGTAILAMPGVVHDPTGPAGTSQIIVSNLSGLPGRTDATLSVIGESGVVATQELSLKAGQVRSVHMQDLGIPPGFHGSAIVSATYWDHALLGPLGDGRKVVGLAGALMNRVDASVEGGARSSVSLAEPLRSFSAGARIKDPILIYLPSAVRDH